MNIVNKVDTGNGVGVLDLHRETYEEIVDDYDEVTVELKVNLKKGEHTEWRIYQIPNGKVKPNSFLEHNDRY